MQEATIYGWKWDNWLEQLITWEKCKKVILLKYLMNWYETLVCICYKTL